MMDSYALSSFAIKAFLLAHTLLLIMCPRIDCPRMWAQSVTVVKQYYLIQTLVDKEISYLLHLEGSISATCLQGKGAFWWVTFPYQRIMPDYLIFVDHLPFLMDHFQVLIRIAILYRRVIIRLSYLCGSPSLTKGSFQSLGSSSLTKGSFPSLN